MANLMKKLFYITQIVKNANPIVNGGIIVEGA
jgi:hypothetical protein